MKDLQPGNMNSEASEFQTFERSFFHVLAGRSCLHKCKSGYAGRKVSRAAGSTIAKSCEICLAQRKVRPHHLGLGC